MVRAIEGLRAQRPAGIGPRSTCGPRSGSYYAATDRRHPALTLERDGHPPVGRVFLGVVSNTAPWTYLGRRPVNPSPLASFDAGLDVFALRRMRTISTLNVVRQMLSGGNGTRTDATCSACMTCRVSRSVLTAR